MTDENKTAVADESLVVQALKSAQSNIAAHRPPGSSDPESPRYDHDAFMWDYYQRAIDSATLASAPVAGEAQLPWHLPVQHWTDEEKAKLLAAPQTIEAYDYARNLAVTMWEKHYKDSSPDWKPFADLMGILYQIDNMVAGMAAPQASEAAWPVDPTTAMIEAMRTGSRKDWPSDELCRVRYAALRSAALSAQPGAQKNGGSDAN